MSIFDPSVTTHPIPIDEGIALIPRVASVCGRPLVGMIVEVLSVVGAGGGTGKALLSSLLADPTLGQRAGLIIDAVAHADSAGLVMDLLRYASVQMDSGAIVRLTDAGARAVALSGDPMRAYLIAAEVAIERGLFSRQATVLVRQLVVRAAQGAENTPIAS